MVSVPVCFVERLGCIPSLAQRLLTERRNVFGEQFSYSLDLLRDIWVAGYVCDQSVQVVFFNAVAVCPQTVTACE
jgi:hypothetical protein